MLLGRGPELEQIGRLVADARDGHGRALLIVGEPGIGKTSLLAQAVALAGDLRVIEAEAVEAEASLPYALLGEIVAPLLNGLDELPEPQADAIRAALALGPSPGVAADRFATCAAFLSLLARAAEREPLLVVVDDAQWVDSASAECLAYAARRLGGTRVALLAASRPTGDGALLGAGDLERLTLPGLSDEHARALLRTTTPDATSSVVDALLEMSAGNPLALRELPAQLSEDQRLGRAPIDHVPMAGEALLEAFESRLAALGSDDRAAVVVASAAMDRELAPVVGACRDLGIESEALERAETANVLTLGEGRISFTHPLLKAVAYERAAPEQRRRAHASACGPLRPRRPRLASGGGNGRPGRRGRRSARRRRTSGDRQGRLQRGSRRPAASRGLQRGHRDPVPQDLRSRPGGRDRRGLRPLRRDARAARRDRRPASAGEHSPHPRGRIDDGRHRPRTRHPRPAQRGGRGHTPDRSRGSGGDACRRRPAGGGLGAAQRRSSSRQARSRRASRQRHADDPLPGPRVVRDLRRPDGRCRRRAREPRRGRAPAGRDRLALARNAVRGVGAARQDLHRTGAGAAGRDRAPDRDGPEDRHLRLAPVPTGRIGGCRLSRRCLGERRG